MMDSIRAAAVSVCLTLLVTGIFSMLVPKNSLERVLKFAVSLFFLSSLVIPLAQGKFDFSVNFSRSEETLDIQTLQEKTEQNFKSLAEKRLVVQIENSLQKKGILCKKIELSIHIDADSRITINTLNVYLTRQDQKEPAFNLIKEELGSEPTVIVEDE